MSAAPTDTAVGMRNAQLKVRHEAQEMQEFLSDFRSWEDDVKEKDERLKAVADRCAFHVSLVNQWLQ